MIQCKEVDTVHCTARQGRGAVALAWSKASVIISITMGGDKLVAHGSQLTMIMMGMRVIVIKVWLAGQLFNNQMILS